MIIRSHILKDASVIGELRGEFLEFTIDDNAHLERMVANIIYYMLKYNCLVAVNEGKAVKSDDKLDTKYALVASPSGLYTADYLLFSYRGTPSVNIKNSGLSVKAQELYRDLFGVDFNTIYQGMQLNDYTRIFEYKGGYSPYLMTNSYEFKRLFDIIFGRGVLIDLFDENEYTP